MGVSDADELHDSNMADDMCGLLHDVFGNTNLESMPCNGPCEDKNKLDENTLKFISC